MKSIVLKIEWLVRAITPRSVCVAIGSALVHNPWTACPSMTYAAHAPATRSRYAALEDRARIPLPLHVLRLVARLAAPRLRPGALALWTCERPWVLRTFANTLLRAGSVRKAVGMKLQPALFNYASQFFSR